MRDHLKIFYDELWAEHVLLSTGKKMKPVRDRHAFGKMKLEGGFKSEKPEWFTKVDEEFTKRGWRTDEIIKWADNRMMQGDYRYGRITRQDLSNYDTVSEFWRRRQVAIDTRNLEYIVDMYNMLRIQAHKDKKINLTLMGTFVEDHHVSFLQEWELTSVDDGIHAIES
jgi:hypothetical protein